jgi:hypothetical protein
LNAGRDDTRGFGFLETAPLVAAFPSLHFAPVTSTIRGVPSEVVLNLVLNDEDGMKSPCAVNLHDAITVSQRRLGKRVWLSLVPHE